MTTGYSAEQVRAAEAALIAQGVPLMARAASALAAQIRALLPNDRRPVVLLLVGSGDNGGDALFAGAELARDGSDVMILSTGSRLHADGEKAAREAGSRVLDADVDLASLVASADVVVDGMLGTGTSAHPALRGRAKEIVERLLPLLEEDADRPSIVAVDLPSGIDPTTGEVPDPTVLTADITVTFGGVKTGLLRHPGSGFAGRIVLAEIGLGAELEKGTIT